MYTHRIHNISTFVFSADYHIKIGGDYMKGVGQEADSPGPLRKSKSIASGISNKAQQFTESGTTLRSILLEIHKKIQEITTTNPKRIECIFTMEMAYTPIFIASTILMETYISSRNAIEDMEEYDEEKIRELGLIVQALKSCNKKFLKGFANLETKDLMIMCNDIEILWTYCANEEYIEVPLRDLFCKIKEEFIRCSCIEPDQYINEIFQKVSAEIGVMLDTIGSLYGRIEQLDNSIKERNTRIKELRQSIGDGKQKRDCLMRELNDNNETIRECNHCIDEHTRKLKLTGDCWNIFATILNRIFASVRIKHRFTSYPAHMREQFITCKNRAQARKKQLCDREKDITEGEIPKLASSLVQIREELIRLQEDTAIGLKQKDVLGEDMGRIFQDAWKRLCFLIAPFRHILATSERTCLGTHAKVIDEARGIFDADCQDLIGWPYNCAMPDVLSKIRDMILRLSDFYSKITGKIEKDMRDKTIRQSMPRLELPPSVACGNGSAMLDLVEIPV